MMAFVKYILFVSFFLLLGGEVKNSAVPDEGLKFTECEGNTSFPGFTMLGGFFALDLEDAVGTEVQEKQGGNFWPKVLPGEAWSATSFSGSTGKKYKAFLSGRHLHGFYVYFLRKLLI